MPWGLAIVVHTETGALFDSSKTIKLVLVTVASFDTNTIGVCSKPWHEWDAMKKRREWLLASLTILITVVICLLIAEIVLRFLPVASGMRTVTVTAQSPVFHFTPNRDFLYSRDWDMVLANRGRVNNAGFVNDQDYHKVDKPPLLAVVGDSMIEASMVPYRETLHARLANSLAGKIRVYSFAASGAPLSQYLIWARHAVQVYGAQALLFSVIDNDYDESHAAYRVDPGFWRYVPDANGELQLRLFEYRPGLLRNVAVSSALGRYLIFNMQLGLQWLQLRSLLFGGPAVAASGTVAQPVNTEEKRLRDSLAVVDAFFRDLPKYVALPPSRIMFMVEGFRYADVAAVSVGGYFDRVRHALMKQASSLGYEVVDLDPFFFEHYRQTGERVEFARDGHWNGTYHRVAFEAVLKSPFMERLGAAYDSSAPSVDSSQTSNSTPR